MTTTTDRTAAPNDNPNDHPGNHWGTARAAAARASVNPRSTAARPGPLDGAWWPRSRSLEHELPALSEALDSLWGRVTRVSVNPQFWPVIPRKVPVNGHLVKVGWFTAEQEPHKLLIICEAAGRRDLLVVPPQTDAAAAARLMSAAADPYNALTATTLMAREAARSAAEAERGREETAAEEWEAEGGHLAPVPAPPAAPAVLSRPVAGRRA